MTRDPFDFFNAAKVIEWQGQTRTASDLASEIESRIESVCYQCGCPSLWLAPDSRCSECTRYLPDEIR